MTEDNVFVEDEAPKKQINFATVAGVYNDGLSLRFDGEDTPSEKHYKCNSFAVFKVGDRVRIIEDSGTYVVEYPIGNPKKTFVADSAKTATTAGSASTASKADSATSASSATTANKLSSSRKISITGAVSGAANFDGSADVTISTTLAGTTTAYNFSNKHTGSHLAFFNGAVTSKKTVTPVTSPSSATVSDVATKLNALISALKSYSLIS